MEDQKKRKSYYIPVVKTRLVYCIELDTTYTNAAEAERALGIDRSTIGKVCRGQRASAGRHPETNERLHWKYIYLGE